MIPLFQYCTVALWDADSEQFALIILSIITGTVFSIHFTVTLCRVETYVLEDRGYFCKEKFMKHLPKILSISALVVLLAFMLIINA